MDIPILFLTFNRPVHARHVLDAIRFAKPSKLYFHNDGPRPNKPGEADLCEQTRDLAKSIDWPCEIITWFRDENAGCKKGVSSAISWFFDHEEMGIILEDDCLPDPSFFPFCEELLHKYRNEDDVFMISGNQFLPDKLLPQNADYYFSQYAFIWGWASWRRAWNNYSLHHKHIDSPKLSEPLKQIVHNSISINYLSEKFHDAFSDKIDSWDFQWFYALLQHKAKSINPKVHLVQNIGIGADSTHTNQVNENLHITTGSLNFPLRHPLSKDPISIQKSQAIFDAVYKSKWKGILWKLSRILKAK